MVHINDKDLMHSAVMFSAGSQLVSYAEYPLYLTRYSFYSNKIHSSLKEILVVFKTINRMLAFVSFSHDATSLSTS